MVNDADNEAQSNVGVEDSDLVGDNADGDLEHIKVCLSRVEVYMDAKSEDNIQDPVDTEKGNGDQYIKEGLYILSDDIDWNSRHQVTYLVAATAIDSREERKSSQWQGDTDIDSQIHFLPAIFL